MYSNFELEKTTLQVRPVHVRFLRFAIPGSWVPFVFCGECQTLQLLTRHLGMGCFESLVRHSHSRLFDHRRAAGLDYLRDGLGEFIRKFYVWMPRHESTFIISRCHARH